MRQRAGARTRMLVAFCLTSALLVVLGGLLLRRLPARATWSTQAGFGLFSEPIGQILSLASGGEAQTLFVATVKYFDGAGERTGSGVYRSDDGGAHWAPANAGLEGQVVRLLSGAGDSRATYAAAEFADGGWWVYRADASGRSWQRVGDRISARVEALVGGAVGQPLFAIRGGAMGGTLLRLDAGGASWRAVVVGESAGVASLLAGDPPGSPLIAVTSQGMYRSLDAGVTWELLSSALGGDAVLRLAGGQQGQPLVAIVRDEPGAETAHLLRSADGGASWQQVPAPGELTRSSSGQFPLRVAGLFGGRDGLPLFLQTLFELYRSDDGGASWQPMQSEGLPWFAVKSIVGRRGQPIFAASADLSTSGVYRSDDDGAHWHRTATGLSGSAVTGLVGGTDGVPLFAGSFVPGSRLANSGNLLRSDDGGRTWDRVPVEGGWGAVYGAFGGAKGLPLFMTTQHRLMRSVDGGERWTEVQVDAGPAPDGGVAARGRLPPIYTTLHGLELYRSDDGGDSWVHLGPAPDQLSVSSVAGGGDGRALFAGTANGLYRSDDGGRSWGHVQLDAMVTAPVHNLRVGAPGRPDLVAAGDSVYRSSDGGRTWTGARVSADGCEVIGIAGGEEGQPLLAGAACPGVNKGGVYRSDDGGATWTTSGEGLPAQSVLRLSGGAAGQPFYVSLGIVALPMDGASGVYRSDDGGRTWANISGWPLPFKVEALALGPGTETLLLEASDGRAFRSADAGAHWGPGPATDGRPRRRGAETAPVTLTFDGDRIVIRQRSDKWAYSVASPLPGERPVAYDYVTDGGRVVLFAVSGSGQLWRGEIQLPLLWLRGGMW